MIHEVMKENMGVDDYLKNNIVYKKNLLKKKLRNKTARKIWTLPSEQTTDTQNTQRVKSTL